MPTRLVSSLCIVLTLLGMAWPARLHALGTISGLQVQNGVVTVEFAENPGVYYLLEHSPDLVTWGPADMSLGIDSVLDLTPGVMKAFRALDDEQVGQWSAEVSVNVGG